MTTLPSGLPERTLGWDILDWGSTFLAQPDGEHKGDTWVYTREQARFLLWFYALDSLGRFIYRRAMLMRVKGFGKSPLLSAISCTELLGPVVFAGWDAAGQPVGKPHPSARVQLAGVSQDQADNTMSLVVEMLGHGTAVDEYGLDIGLTRVYSATGGKLEPVTASIKSREGQRPTFASLDETGLWTPAAKGPQLAATIRRNLAKVGGRSIETTNAFMPGEDSVAESTWEYYQSILDGRADDPGLLVDSRSAEDDVDIRDKHACMAALRYCYGDSTWVDLDRIWAEIQDPATHEAEARRFYLNQIVAGDEQWIPKAQWDACALHDAPIEPGEEITLGFDGGIRDDSTALVGVRVSDGLVFPIKIWERPYGDLDWEVDVLDVDAWLRKIYGRFKVVRLNADPAYWQDIVGRWSLEYPGTVWEWWTNRPTAMAKAVERFETAVATKALRHTSDATLTRHVMNTKVEETAWGRKLKKDAKGGSRKIDGAIAAILAYEARAEYLTDPPPPEGIVFGF